MEHKFFFFDIDGTLRTRDNYTIPQSAIAAINQLKQSGHQVMLATGRGFYSARNMGRLVGVDDVISDGGRMVYLDGQVIYRHPMRRQVISQIETLAQRYQAQIGYSDEFAIHSISSVFMEAFKLDQTIICSVKENLNPQRLGLINKLYLWLTDHQSDLEKELGDVEHHWLRPNLCVIEHMHKDEGIQIVMKEKSLKAQNCICFGDDLNDITMFQLCGYSVCMANGSPEAKKYASYQAPDIHDDGIWKACLAHGWLQEERKIDE